MVENAISSAGVAALIGTKKRSIEHMAAHAARIYDRLIFIYGSTRPDLAGAAKRLVDEIVDSAAKIDGQLPAFEIGALVGTCDGDFADLADLMAKFSVEDSSGASQTYRLETAKEINSFSGRYMAYVASETTAAIFKAVIGNLKLEPADAEAEFMRNPRGYAFYAAYLHSRLSGCKAADCWQYMELLERAKNWALGADPIPAGAHEWPLQRFGLVPAVQHLSHLELAKHLFKSSSFLSGNVALVDVIALAQTNNINVLTLWYITPAQIEYVISQLLNGVEMPKNAGVDNKMVATFDMIRRADAADSTGAAPARGYTAQEHRHCASCKWHVIRTFDGLHWDVMAAGDGNVVHVSIVDRILRGPSPRAAAHGQIKAQIVANSLNLAPKARIEEMAADKVKYKPVVDAMVNIIVARIISYVDKSLVPLPTNPAGVEEAINDPKFAEIMYEELLASFSQLKLSGRVPIGDLVATFLSDLESPTGIMTQFKRSIRVNILELGLGSKLFKEYTGETLRTRLYSTFVDVLKRSVQTAVMTKKNIYEKVLMKDHILHALQQ